MRWHKLSPGIRIGEVVNNEDKIAGWVISHYLPSEHRWCEGWVPRNRQDNNPRAWNTSTGSLKEGNLTLLSNIHSVSVQCHTHLDFHGFVRDGKWVPA